MAKRLDANLFKILVGQVGQNIKINAVLSKALGVLVHTDLAEPVRNRIHRSPPE